MPLHRWHPDVWMTAVTAGCLQDHPTWKPLTMWIFPISTKLNESQNAGFFISVIHICSPLGLGSGASVFVRGRREKKDGTLEPWVAKRDPMNSINVTQKLRVSFYLQTHKPQRRVQIQTPKASVPITLTKGVIYARLKIPCLPPPGRNLMCCCPTSDRDKP